MSFDLIDGGNDDVLVDQEFFQSLNGEVGYPRVDSIRIMSITNLRHESPATGKYEDVMERHTR